MVTVGIFFSPMSAWFSMFVVVEYVPEKSRRGVFLFRLVIEKDQVIINEGDSIKTAGLEESSNINETLATDGRLCKCSTDWLSGREPFPGHCCLLRLSPCVFSCLVHEITKSPNFRNNLIIRTCLRRLHKKRSGLLRYCPSCSSLLGERFHLAVRIVLRWEGPFILDKPWIYRLENLMQERLMFDEMLAGLSTLGGAFSSLGDELVEYAQTAGRISLQQLRLAFKLGDQVLISKCKLFLALSLMQQGRISLPKRIIREQYEVAKNLPENQKDIRLENMCKGAWVKLQYIHRQRKKIESTKPNVPSFGYKCRS